MYDKAAYSEEGSMSEIRSFRDLHAWQAGMRVVERTYQLTADFPNDERYGLVSQMRRASVSIPSNVAEGNAVVKPRWTIRFVLNGVGSACELATQLEAALRLGFCTADAAKGLNQELEHVLKLLYGLKRERERRLAAAAGAVVCAAILLAGLAL
jgi:four helix bundle protein